MIGEKSNIAPRHKKDSRNLIKNYRPISLLPIFSKVFERLTYNSLYNFFIQNKHFTECRPAFMSRNSCGTQLLSITHETYKSFDYNPLVDITGVFLDILKAFDKVCHDDLIFKLQTYGIDSKLLKLIKSYLTDWQQRVLLNGEASSWKNVLAGVPQGSVLELLLFLPYINYLPDKLTSVCKIFSYDAPLFSKASNRKNLKLNLTKISRWFANRNISGKHYLFLTLPNKLQKFASHINVIMFFTSLWFLMTTKYNLHLLGKHWGLILDSKLDFIQHIDDKIKQCHKFIGSMRRLSITLCRKSLLTITIFC